MYGVCACGAHIDSPRNCFDGAEIAYKDQFDLRWIKPYGHEPVMYEILQYGLMIAIVSIASFHALI